MATTGKYFLRLRGKNLPIKDLIDSDPYFILKTQNATRYKSEVIKDELNPSWEGFVFEDLGGDYMLTIEIWDKDLTWDDFMAQCVIPIEELRNGSLQNGAFKGLTKRNGSPERGQLSVNSTKCKSL